MLTGGRANVAYDNDITDVAEACTAAEAAFDAFRAKPYAARANFLERVADEILAIGDELLVTAEEETGLPRMRLEGEKKRTAAQLRLFASVVRDGHWLTLRIDPALPDRQPLPRGDLRLRRIPVGPVAVFGASNFPLAFSTAGGDTASALAAGCPVIVKGHPDHPRTGAIIAAAVLRAVEASGMPKGVFGHLAGTGHAIGAALVEDPRVAAVGFTGSRAGGLALLRLAQSRRVPIPVYAEMSSINPVLLMPHALAARGTALGAAFAASLVMGAGQFCTNPGLVLAVEGPGLDEFISAACAALAQGVGTRMLSPAIHTAYCAGVEALAGHPAIETLIRGPISDGDATSQSAVFATTATAFLTDERLGHEVFGAASLIVRCASKEEFRDVLIAAEGQLTASLQLDAADEAAAARLMPLLERKAGRILANGWPTGVEVTHAMVHGGPYPATSDARSTSVGSLAIERFLRPICYQDLPLALLPAELRDDATGLPVTIDGRHG